VSSDSDPGEGDPGEGDPGEGDLRRVRIDKQALRVLAHPLRSRLLSRLRSRGPATATALAKDLDTNSGATSYHLRKLAAVGLVEETDEGSGRERWWRAAHDMHSFYVRDFAGDPDSEAALEWLEGEYFQQFTDYARRWAAERSRWPVEWRDVAGASDYMLDLTAAELGAMQQEIYAVVERYREGGLAADRTTDADPLDDRRRVLFYMHCLPDVAERR
jgi:DNA-binding transcriptional ArsR family regulator